ncbi:MAG: RNA methyltransferase [Clostridia bacterium]|nr:RNA methyltransferase [Clostridia bacterium]
MQVITSRENEQIKQIRKLKDKKYRDAMGLYVVEGIKTVNEAIAENADIQTIVICDDSNEQNELKQKMLYTVAKFDIIYVTEKVFEAISHVMHPQGILAVIKKKKKTEEINYKDDVILILENIQDPGNLGTIIRTVDSCGLSQVIISKDTTDAYAPKVVRSTMSRNI